MRSRLRPFAAPLGLLVVAIGALFLPTLVAPFVPTQPFDAMAQEMRMRTYVSYALAALLVMGACVAAARSHARSGDARPLTALLVLGAIVALVGAAPMLDEAQAEAVHARYAATGTLTPAEGVSLGGLYSGDGGTLVFQHAHPSEAATSPHVVGEIPITRGDLWMAGYVINGERWDGFEPPRLVSPGVRCQEAARSDAFGAKEQPHFSIIYQCVAERTGTTTLSLEGSWPSERTHQVIVNAAPTSHALVGTRLDGALLGIGIGTLLGGALLTLGHATCFAAGAPRRRADGLVAAALAALGLVWAALLVWRGDVVGTPAAPILLVAAAGAALAAHLAWAWLRVPHRPSRGRALLASGAVAAGGLATVPVILAGTGRDLPIPLLLVAGLATLVLAAAASARWWSACAPATAAGSG